METGRGKNYDLKDMCALYWGKYKNRVVKEPCVICESNKSLGHHMDYSKPLEVIWMCQKHHCKLHSLCLTQVHKDPIPIHRSSVRRPLRTASEYQGQVVPENMKHLLDHLLDDLFEDICAQSEHTTP